MGQGHADQDPMGRDRVDQAPKDRGHVDQDRMARDHAGQDRMAQDHADQAQSIQDRVGRRRRDPMTRDRASAIPLVPNLRDHDFDDLTPPAHRGHVGQTTTKRSTDLWNWKNSYFYWT